MENQDRRKRKRFALQWSATLHSHLESGLSIDAVAQDLSPAGAFLKTENWRSFQVNDRTLLTFFLPADFTGQKGTIGLQGSAVITRIDQENEGIGVQFVENLKQFREHTLVIVESELGFSIRIQVIADSVDYDPFGFNNKFVRIQRPMAVNGHHNPHSQGLVV